MNPRSLPFRLVAWYALWLSVVFVIASTLVYFGLRRYLEHSLATEQIQRAQRIATLALQSTRTNPNSLAGDITARFAPEAFGPTGPFSINRAPRMIGVSIPP